MVPVLLTILAAVRLITAEALVPSRPALEQQATMLAFVQHTVLVEHIIPVPVIVVTLELLVELMLVTE